MKLSNDGYYIKLPALFEQTVEILMPGNENKSSSSRDKCLHFIILYNWKKLSFYLSIPWFLKLISYFTHAHHKILTLKLLY